MKINFFVILIGIITISSCKKEDEVNTNFTALSVYNASPTLSTYDAYFNDAKINSAALPFAGGLNYSRIDPGTYTLKFTTAGRTENLLTKSIALSVNTYYTYFLINRPATLDGVLISDDVSATSGTNVFVRFINLSPDAPALDLVVNGGVSIATNKSFKEASSYTSIAAGTYTFDVKDKVTGVVKTSLTGAVLTAGFHYTIISGGLITPANTNERPLSAQLIKQQ